MYWKLDGQTLLYLQHACPLPVLFFLVSLKVRHNNKHKAVLSLRIKTMFYSKFASFSHAAAF